MEVCSISATLNHSNSPPLLLTGYRIAERSAELSEYSVERRQFR